MTRVVEVVVAGVKLTKESLCRMTNWVWETGNTDDDDDCQGQNVTEGERLVDESYPEGQQS